MPVVNIRCIWSFFYNPTWITLSPLGHITTITIDVSEELESSQMDPGSSQKACVCWNKIEVENIRLLFCLCSWNKL